MVPSVKPEQMEQVVRRYAPTAHIEVRHINPAYSSWSMSVSTSQGELEFVWGPLTGFGVSDFALHNDNPLASFDLAFESLQAAETYFAEHVSSAP